MGLPTGQKPKTHFKRHSEMVQKALESSEMASNESSSESHKTSVKRSQNSSWDSRIQGFIRHIINYTVYNQQGNVSQVRLMDRAIISNTTQDNIQKYR